MVKKVNKAFSSLMVFKWNCVTDCQQQNAEIIIIENTHHVQHENDLIVWNYSIVQIKGVLLKILLKIWQEPSRTLFCNLGIRDL